MSDEREFLSKKSLIVIGITSATIFVGGIILLALGYNEAFYVDNALVQIIFEIITFTGEALFFIILISIFYVAYDKRFAKNMAFSLLFSVYLNQFIKDIIQDPRPPTNADPDTEYGLRETGYGFPSGHAQNAVATWGYISYEFKDKSKPPIVPVILSILIILIAISRIILGMHDLQDIIGGLLIGMGFLISFIYLEPFISEKVNALNLTSKIIITTVVSLSLFIIGTLLFPTSGLQLVNNPPYYSDASAYGQVGGVILGLGVGYLLENEYINYEPTELNNKQKVVNLIITIVILIVTYLALGLLISGNVVLRFIRYTLISFILAFFVPLILIKINRK